MSKIGQRERATQDRVVRLFRQQLKYEYFGNWEERLDNRNIEPDLLKAFLKRSGYADNIIAKAIYEVEKAAGDLSKSLYDRNRAFYNHLRYGVKVRPDVGENKVTVWLIHWKKAENNDFAIAEEVTVARASTHANDKRPDIVVYVNGLALGVLELKRSSVTVEEGIRQNLDNQKKEFIEPFFSTMQFVMAGNDTQGLRFGTIQTPEKHYLTWKEEAPNWTPKLGLEQKYLGSAHYPGSRCDLDRALLQMMPKARFLDLIHNFVVFDAGTKKVCRHNQFFAVHACQKFAKRREGGIVWNTQGSGKSLIMVWLAKWIRENIGDARVLMITDRTELDEQIEAVFLGVKEEIYRTDSGADLIAHLNATEPWLICSLIHKFGGKVVAEDDERATKEFIAKMKEALPVGFKTKGNLFVFVDECHRTQSGKLHEAMKEILPGAVFIGFTGTPLLKADKATSLETFGTYIHTYKFDEGVKDKVILDLRYEARDIDQHITSQAKIDQWFEAKTRGLTPLAKAQLKQRWGTMRKVLSSQSRLEKIVADILMDMETKDRLKSGRGNAMLVSGSIYQACKFFELFERTDLKGKCAIVTSYAPTPQDIKGEETGEGLTEKLRQYDIYRKMLADHFHEPEETAAGKVEKFEVEVKKRFIDEPGQMKLLIVVDKLLTGFDAPPATYLYIDKTMHDHGPFQAICRVNRIHGEDKDYGYIIDYKDLFTSLEGAIKDYTRGSLSGYEKSDVEGLLKNRLEMARQHLEDSLEAIRELCEQVEIPKDQTAYLRYFSSVVSGNATQLKESEPRRLSLYKATAALVRAYSDIANEMAEAGFSEAETQTIKSDVKFYEELRSEVKLHSGDAIDLKRYEPAMRHLIDAYIRADASEVVSDFDDLSLLELIVQRGAAAIESLPEGLRKNRTAVAETIENNVRKIIVDEQPINPRYFDKMSQLLDALIEQRRQEAIEYQEYLRQIVELTKKVKNPATGSAYAATLNTPGKRALFDNLGRDETLALAVDAAVRAKSQDEWRTHPVKTKIVRSAIKAVLPDDAANLDAVLDLVRKHNEY